VNFKQIAVASDADNGESLYALGEDGKLYLRVDGIFLLSIMTVFLRLDITFTIGKRLIFLSAIQRQNFLFL